MAKGLLTIIAALSIAIPSNNNISSEKLFSVKTYPHHDFESHFKNFNHASPDIPEVYFPDFLDECTLSLGYLELLDNGFTIIQNFVEEYDCTKINEPVFLYNLEVRHTLDGRKSSILSYMNDNSNGSVVWGRNSDDVFEAWFDEGYLAVTLQGTYVNKRGEIPYIIENDHERISFLSEWYGLLSSSTQIIE